MSDTPGGGRPPVDTPSGDGRSASGPDLRSGFLRLVAVVARRDYLRTVRRRGFIFGTLLLPIGLAGLFALSALLSPSAAGTGGSTAGVHIVVVDQSRLGLRSQQPVLEVLSAAAADQAIRAGTIEEYYIIPASWPGSPDVQRVEAAGGALNALQRRATQDEALAAILRSALLTTSGVRPDLAARILAPVQVTAVTVDGGATSEAATIASFLVPFGFTLLFVMSIFITSGYLLQSVTEEKENRVVEILLSSVPSLPLMAGKVVGLGAAGLTQVAIWVGALLFAIPLISSQVGGLGDLTLSPAVLVLALVYFVLGYLAYGAIFAAIGAVAPGNREAQQYSGFFGFMAVIPLIFSSAFLSGDVMASPIVWALVLIPVTTPAAMLMVLAVSPEIPVPMVVASLVTLGTFTVLATIGSARVFRATLLLYGVRPSLRRILDAMLARG
jgi:ABC-2 type transport system permease protein